MSGTKPNFTGTGNTIKGKEINKWVHKPNHKPKPRQKKATNHSQLQPNPIINPKKHHKLCLSLSHPQKKFQKTTINSDTVPMDHPDQAKHTPDNGKPVHALVDLDIAISAHAGFRSAVAVEQELLEFWEGFCYFKQCS